MSNGADNFLYIRNGASGTADHVRTTYAIVWSCALTIVVCVCSSVHPNIPGPFDGRWTILKRRMTTTFCALIAPEFVVMWALRQYLAAKKIKEKYNERFVLQGPVVEQSYVRGIVAEWLASAKKAIYNFCADLPPNTAVRRRPRLIKGDKPVGDREPWTTKHGFFVQMGGFMLNEGENPKNVLDFDNMCEMISNGQIAAPTVTEVELKDRSKVNMLWGCVIALQASWFVIQCLARLASHLPLSELEVVTLGFVVMNGIACCVWWDKPKGVSAAIPIHFQFPEVHACEPTEAVVEDLMLSGSNFEGPSKTELTPLQEKYATDKQDKMQLLGVEMMSDPRSQETATAETAPSNKLGNKKYSTTSNNSSCLQHFSKIVKFPLVQIFHMIFDDEGILDGAMQVPTFYAHGYGLDELLITAACGIATLFGAVFACASVFPSDADESVWRVSVLAVTAGPPFFLLGAILKDAYTVSTKNIRILFAAWSVVYILARVALLIVAFLSLRALPQDVLVQVGWTFYIPHF